MKLKITMRYPYILIRIAKREKNDTTSVRIGNNENAHSLLVGTVTSEDSLAAPYKAEDTRTAGPSNLALRCWPK